VGNRVDDSAYDLERGSTKPQVHSALLVVVKLGKQVESLERVKSLKVANVANIVYRRGAMNVVKLAKQVESVKVVELLNLQRLPEIWPGVGSHAAQVRMTPGLAGSQRLCPILRT
jgi:hypothetical protein